MATAFRKMGVYLGLVEDDDYADGGGTESYGALARDPQYHRREVEVAPARAGYEAAGPEADGYDDYDATYEQPPQRITTLHPRTYNEAKTIGLQFRAGTPVIMNLSEMDDADAKRLVDFAAGLTFGLHGSIERVTPKVFLLSPHNVSVTAADKQRIVEGGFYNQS
ncbi:MAG TPA: cell division protein SepF [Jatrophihabitans sp.]|uniref:cell division protein SepF n=1 Tax=Jatrophihabitans sp. TaxID=1932789 RepID=UPI002EEFFE35